MNTFQLLLRSLTYHWRAHVAVLMCVAVGTTVLGGALLVGDSMRGSLRDLTLDRLGRIEHELSAPRFFGADLADRVGKNFIYPDVASSNDHTPVSIQIEPAILLRGSAAGVDASGRETARAGRVQICGVTREFWQLNRTGVAARWAAEWDDADQADTAVINESLALELGVQNGDTLLVRIEKPSDVPREATLGRKGDTVQTIRLTVGPIATAADMGSFRLDASQRDSRNLFIPLDRLARAIGQPSRANTLLVRELPRDGGAWPESARDGAAKETAELQGVLAEQIRLSDLGLQLRVDETRGYLSLESSRMLLEPAVADTAVHVADQLRMRVAPTIVYLANSISKESNEKGLKGIWPHIPYSIVAAIPLDNEPPFGPFEFVVGEATDTLRDNEILLNTWAADDLEVPFGKQVRLSYFAAEPVLPFETAESTFRVRGVVRMRGAAADPGLVPEYPGITDAKTYADWDPPFPMDLKRIRQKDEAYWEKYRTTPKAFVSLATGERLWGSRFGKWTSIRLAASQTREQTGGRTVQEVSDAFERELLRRLRPEQLGFVFQPVKAQGLDASKGGTDFGELFLAFSFFLIVSAAILIGLVFRLGVERRAKQVGLLLALGFSQAGVRMLLILEGLVVAALGSVAGLAGAVGYAWLVMAGLRTWWFPAVGTSLLRLHVPLTTLGIGAVAGLVLAILAILISLRGLVRLTPRALLAGGVTESLGRVRRRGRTVGIVVWATVVLTLLLAVAFGGESPMLFFIVGAVMLVGLLAAVAARMDAADQRPIRNGGVWAIARLGVRNAYRHRWRSALTVGLVAFATFVIVAVGANRRDDESSQTAAGETRLVAESSVPLLHDLNDPAGRRELGLPEDSAYWLSGVTVSRFRVKEGEDASCLNLYQPKRPRILGVPDEVLKQITLTLSSSLAHSSRRLRPTWRVISQDSDSDVVPTIGDANSVKWILHLGLGDRLPITAEDGKTVDLQIVGLLDRSVFQSELLISEANFRKLFPNQIGYSYFLIEENLRESDRPRTYPQTSGDHQATLLTVLEQHLSAYGFDATPVADRLAEYHAVENTYLATFQMLGGLGLVLGTLGLGAVLLRSVFERRGELALLLAVGFRPAALAWLVLSETAFLLVAGLAIGTVSAAAAVAPHLIRYADEVPWLSLSGIALVLTFGLLSSGAAVLATIRTPLLPALRSE